MLLSYLADKKSWLYFYFASIGLIDFVLWADQGIHVELMAVLYFNLLLLVAFIIFVIWRYRAETKFIKELGQLLHAKEENWHVALPEAFYMQDRMIKEILHSVANSFSNRVEEVRRLSIQEGEYTAAWVHEVKTPLTAMKLIIDEHKGDPAFKKVETEWLRLHLLIDQQLSISRLPSLEADYVLEKTNVQKLISAEVRELASWCMKKNIAVEFVGDGVEVVTDIKWCRFMIRQFLTNAIKYSPVGGIITIFIEENELGYAVVKLQDEGPGVESHDLPRIFEKGFTGGTGRIHNASSGLGLYLAQTVASKIGITLQANAQPKKGMVIEVLFPNENDYDKTLT